MKIEITKKGSISRNSSYLSRNGILTVFMMMATAGYSVANETDTGVLNSSVQAAAADTSNQINGSIPFSYAFYAGSTFLPFSTEAGFAYKGAGCIYSTGGTEKRFLHKVLLPEGADIHYVRIYSYDANPSNLIAGMLTTYDAVGNYNELHLTRSVDGGYGSVLSPLLNYTVDHYAQPINMVINLGNANAPDLAFCGVRIAYKLSDLIFKNGFD